MIAFSKQRAIGWIIFVTLSVIVMRVHSVYAGIMPGLPYLTGWALWPSC